MLKRTFLVQEWNKTFQNTKLYFKNKKKIRILMKNNILLLVIYTKNKKYN